MKIVIKTNVNLSKLDIGKLNQIGLVNSSQELVRIARNNAPYDTGTLKKSIWAEPWHITTSTKKVIIWPRKVVYAQRREFENKKNPDRKFYMKRTYDEAEKVVQKEFDNALKIIVRKFQ